MNDRQRFVATMHYQERDRCPLYDFNYWPETLPVWHAQGLPQRYNAANVEDFFGLDCSLAGGENGEKWTTGVHDGLFPQFESEILSDDGDVYTVMQGDGVIVRRQRSSVSIPMHVGHTLVDRQSWKEHYLKRLDPANPGRIPADWSRRVEQWIDPHRDYPIFAPGGSLFGRLRDWMGLENIALVIYDDPAWFEEMVTTLADLSVAMLKRIFATGASFEACTMWEDMCYNAGPLLSPEHFKQFLVPHYRRITDLCRKHGVDIVWIDCDGRIDSLIPLWLDAGVNCMFPIEIGRWGADPVAYRRQFGRDLRMMGGFDKHILAAGPHEIEREVDRLAPLVEEGGYIPMPDHRVPPTVPLRHYMHYLRTIRRRWGKGVFLNPIGELVERDSYVAAAAY